MRQAYVRELKPYSVTALAGEFGMEPGQALLVIGGADDPRYREISHRQVR